MKSRLPFDFMIEQFLKINRQMYEAAKRENKKVLQEVILKSINKTIENNKARPTPKQYTLF